MRRSKGATEDARSHWPTPHPFVVEDTKAQSGWSEAAQPATFPLLVPDTLPHQQLCARGASFPERFPRS